MAAAKVAQFIFKVGKNFHFRRQAGTLKMDKSFPTLERAVAYRASMAPTFDKVKAGILDEEVNKLLKQN